MHQNKDHEPEWVPSRVVGRDSKYIVTHVCCLYCEKEHEIGEPNSPKAAQQEKP